MLLGVNVDHVAVLREARQISSPDPLEAVYAAIRAGADQITIHLREDRRHINDYDAKRIVENSAIPVNIECSVNPDIVEIVAKLKPSRVTIVPENREEVTTEGGLDLEKMYADLDATVHYFKAREIEVSLFIDPTIEAVRGAKGLGVEWVELHTGEYANIYAMLNSNLSLTPHSIKELEISRKSLKIKLANSLKKLKEATDEADDFGLRVAAGHGLNYQNVGQVAKIDGIIELNIGQSIVASSIFCGFEKAVEDMKKLL
ncbi:MAG TPA: pyridoxine 5'-phosphate synthase [Campylobacterales bacterium]|nr:pyridoxine 5'-phosphate synthase [Campylobacterales bacterium]